MTLMSAQSVGSPLTTVQGEFFHEDIYGGVNADTLSGAGGDDQLFGGAGDDTIDGGTGSDRIDRGDGDDTLTGGAGADWFAGLLSWCSHIIGFWGFIIPHIGWLC